MERERPQWSAIRGVIDGLQRTLEDATQTRQQVMEITGTAWSDDRMIKAVVGPRGQLIELEIDPRIYRTPNSKALSASILSTVRAAVEEANRKTREVMDRVMPKTDGFLPKTDFDVMLDNHDADLPQAMRKREEEGHGYVS
ncbi:YbaB/EbfC family nucleoid-associated protein [Micromonospora sp. NBC_01796]|uniref:YbaB/EbfC family nucleoid-associated protein n=1 Tax=Micromonospora sp. NBC_01796 TaxID=2975987 RepID=UPI002DDA48E3|nr:YbaB/EbfC family nucleoid-associated protein [Micromonospora sp. NBC_01796]WSA85075.1 YbaB/EbfC family nucleoid-associated protein [Micromonospora sp. NBC_01796]